MNQKKFKNNFDVKLHKLEVLSRNDIHIQVIVIKKSTGEWDHYGWTPDCYGAEPHFGTFFDGYETVDMAVMEYIREEIWFNCPIKLAEPSELEFYEDYNKRLKEMFKKEPVVKKTTLQKVKELFKS